MTRHYAESGLSRRRGDVAKRSLISEGFLKAVEIAVPEGRVVLLEPAERGERWLRRHRVPLTPVHGSRLHAYWAGRVGRTLELDGWAVEYEHRVAGHAFDVHATKGDRSLLCEVETGKSQIASNLLALGSARVEHAAVVWIDPLTIDRARTLAPDGVAVVQPRQLHHWVASVGRARPAPLTPPPSSR